MRAMVFVLVLASCFATWAPHTWAAEPFSATAADLLASKVAPRQGVEAVVLARQDDYVFDSLGRLRHRRYTIFQILDTTNPAPPSGSAWAVSEVLWAPRHQASPEVRARVITPDGEILMVDPTRVRSTPVDADTFQSRQLLRLPLPGLVPGAVVEEEISLVDRQPLYPVSGGAAGSVHHHSLALAAEVRKGRLILDVPLELPLRHEVVELLEGEGKETVRLQETAENGRRRLIFDYGPLSVASMVEAGLPPEVPRHPAVVFSTGESWKRVATAFGELVVGVLKEARVEPFLVARPTSPGEGELGAEEVVAEMLALVRHRVRTAGLPFGSASLLPSVPQATLRRGSGDAKDQALLLVALLRQRGITAHLALLRSGFGIDLDLEMPGLGRFDHVVVLVPGERPLWIDPSDPFSRLGTLPASVQDRLALVVSPRTEGLVRTPVAESADNRTVVRVEVLLGEEGAGRIADERELHGEAERRQRHLARTLDLEDRVRAYEKYVVQAYGASSLGRLLETDLEDLSSPYRLRLEALDARRARADGEEAVFTLVERELVSALPSALLVESTALRRHDFIFHEPFVLEHHYSVVAPPGMEVVEVPRDRVLSLAKAELRRSVSQERTDEGQARVVLSLRLDSGARRISAEEFEALRVAARSLLVEKPLEIRFRK